MCNLCSQQGCDGMKWRKNKPPTSFPRGIPLPRAQVRPITLATNVLKVRYSFRTTPLSIVFISGIPEPGKWKGRDARWDDGVERKELKESNYRERDEENKWRARRGGWGGKLIDIHIVFCMRIASKGIFGYIWISCRCDHWETYSSCPWMPYGAL